MSTPLDVIDANPRQRGFKLTKEGSKIPSPPKFLQPRSTSRHSPFSVSTTGSPCHTASSAAFKNFISPAPFSKPPCKSMKNQGTLSKSGTYSNRPLTPRSSLPRARGWQRPSNINSSSTSNTRKTSPPLSCDKPLPSPPIAHIVNSASPPKAKRTLVDAEAGTPTVEQWPVLRPENVSLSKSPVFSYNKDHTQRSVSESSAVSRNTVPVLKSQALSPLSEDGRVPIQQNQGPTADGGSSEVQHRQLTESRGLSSTNPYTQPFHAFSTNTEVAHESLSVHKQRTSPGVIIPPRISSKRSFVPSSSALVGDLPWQTQSVTLRPVKPGSTKWPLLADADKFPEEQAMHEDLSHTHHRLVAEPGPIESTSFAEADMAPSRYGSIDSVSIWSLGAESSLDDGSEFRREGNFRVKRLSWYSSNSGSGPTLRIFADADRVLLGREESIPAVPALPQQVTEQSAQERPTSNLVERVSKQILVKMTSIAGSRIPTPPIAQTELTKSTSVRISPIRSMQPARDFSTGRSSIRSVSASTHDSMEVSKEESNIASSQAEPRCPLETMRAISLSQIEPELKPQAHAEDQKTDSAFGQQMTSFPNELPRSATNVLGVNEETPQSESEDRTYTTETKSGSASLKTVTRIRASPFFPSSERLRTRATHYSSRSPSLASSKFGGSVPSRAGTRQPGSSKLGVTEPRAHASGDSFCRSTSKDLEANKQSVDAALKTKLKHSFKNIFHKHDSKTTPQSVVKRESKRSSLTGGALAQRFRDSTNLYKVNSARPSATSSSPGPVAVVHSHDSERLDHEHQHQAVLSAPELLPAILLRQPERAAQHDTAYVVQKILDRVDSVGKDSPDRLRGLEIAEAVVSAAECSKKANLSAELARKHARKAELHADRAGFELDRLANLCESSFDDQTRHSIKQLITAVGRKQRFDDCRSELLLNVSFNETSR